MYQYQHVLRGAGQTPDSHLSGTLITKILRKETKVSKEKKMQIILRGKDYIVRRATGEYGYQIEGSGNLNNGIGYESVLPISQEMVADLFKENGLVWRWEQRQEGCQEH